MTQSFNYKNFYQLLQLENHEQREIQLKEIIDTYLGQYFYVEDRTWFNMLVNYGLLNLVKHCENTIVDFSLYDNSKDSNHASNVSFTRAIQSGNIELVDYFFNHKDFDKFSENENNNNNIYTSLIFHDTRVRKFDVKNFEILLLKIVDKFPSCILGALDYFVRFQKNDEITPALISMVKKYSDVLHPYLDDSPTENNLTRLSMVSLNYNSVKFGSFLRTHYKNIMFQPEFMSFFLLFIPKPHTLDYLLENPDFFELEEKQFTKMFEYVFKDPITKKYKKEDYEFFFKVTKLNLHKVTATEMQQAINKNLAPFVRKYYSQFKHENFNLNIDNTCTKFIHKRKTEQMYKDYLKKYPPKNIVEKKFKI